MFNDHQAMAERPGKDTTPPSKIETMLALFVDGKHLNRFDAESYHDHCLHSTVATLESLGIRISREWERVPCLGGRAMVRVKRYWLDAAPDNVAAARRVLAAWRRS